MSQQFRQATDLLFSREKPWRRPLLVYRLLISPSKKYPPLGKIVLRYDRKLRLLVKSYPELAPRYLNQLKRISSKKKTHTLAVTFAEEQPNNAELMVYLANYWYGEKAAKRGDELLSRAKELAPNLPLIYEEEAASQQWRNNFSRELDALNQLVTLYQEGSSEFTITMNRLAFLRYRMRDYIAADQIYTQYLLPEFSVKGILAALRCAQVLAKEDRAKELETLLMLQQSNDLELPIHLAREYIKLQDYLACSFMLEQAEAEGLADTEDFVQTKIQLAWLENRWDDALKVVQDALAHFKTLPNNSYLDYVEIAIALGDIETALQILDRCAPDGEADFHISYRKGMLLREKGCFKEAWESFAAAGTTLAISEDAEPPFSRVLSTALLDTANNETSQYLHSVSRRRNIAFQSYMLAKHHAAQGEFQTACDLAVRMSNAKVSGFPRFRSSFSFRAREARNAFEHFSEIVETLPIDESLVVYESFHGASTSCNPLALCLYALETPELAHLRHVWIIKPGSPIDDRLANDPRVSFVSRGSEGSLLASGTAAYVINNTSLPGWYFRRLGQRYLNTWHGIPWKHLGKKVTSEPFAY
ncbi:MAG: CDP-glycerol glycerophosphotransferase family protein, partial [Microbacteriaceae bacterium]